VQENKDPDPVNHLVQRHSDPVLVQMVDLEK